MGGGEAWSTQGWRKIHLGVDQAGSIVAQTLTDANADDATTGLGLLDDVDDKLETVVADSVFDTRPFYAAGADRGARMTVPPIKTAIADGAPCPQRDRCVRRVGKVGRRQWKKEVDYHRQRRTENAFFRLKTIIGDRMRARGSDAQVTEARLGCNMLNRMFERGRPESYAIEN